MCWLYLVIQVASSVSPLDDYYCSCSSVWDLKLNKQHLLSHLTTWSGWNFECALLIIPDTSTGEGAWGRIPVGGPRTSRKQKPKYFFPETSSFRHMTGMCYLPVASRNCWCIRELVLSASIWPSVWKWASISYKKWQFGAFDGTGSWTNPGFLRKAFE